MRPRDRTTARTTPGAAMLGTWEVRHGLHERRGERAIDVDTQRVGGGARGENRDGVRAVAHLDDSDVRSLELQRSQQVAKRETVSDRRGVLGSQEQSRRSVRQRLLRGRWPSLACPRTESCSCTGHRAPAATAATAPPHRPTPRWCPCPLPLPSRALAKTPTVTDRGHDGVAYFRRGRQRGQRRQVRGGHAH